MVETKVRIYKAGSCSQAANVEDRYAKKGSKDFPALFGVITHPSHGKILFDTGYSSWFAEGTKKFPYSIYAKATPVTFDDNKSAKAQLLREGTKPTEITDIIISHFHGDHIAGLKDFPNAKIWTSKKGYDHIVGRKGFSALLKGFVPGLLPEDFEDRVRFIEDKEQVKLDSKLAPFDVGYDIFGDRSVLGISLPGHSRGHIGAYSSNYFFIGDAAWSMRAIQENLKQSRKVNIITDNVKEYYSTLGKLHQLYLNNRSLAIIPAHCNFSQQIRVG